MKFVKLSEVVKSLESGGRPKGGVSGDTGTIPSLGAEHLSETGKIDFENKKYISEEFYKKLKTGKIEKEDILIVKDGATTGKVAYVDKDFKYTNAAINEHVFKLTVEKSIINAKFLYFFLKSESGKKQLMKDYRGATIGGISRKILELTNVPIPSFEEQIRIADILSRAEALIAKRKETIKMLDEYLKSVFLDMFGDPVRNEKGWEKKRIDEIADIRIGPFGSLLHASDYIEGGVPLINPSHMVDGKAMPDIKLTLSEEKYNELKTYHLRRNDVVVARRGEIGRTVVVDTDKPLLCGTGSMFVRIKNEYSPFLLHYQISKTTLKDYLDSKAKGITMKNLNSEILGATEIIFPTQESQGKFIRIAECIKKIEKDFSDNMYYFQLLYNSLIEQKTAEVCD